MEEENMEESFNDQKSGRLNTFTFLFVVVENKIFIRLFSFIQSSTLIMCYKTWGRLVQLNTDNQLVSNDLTKPCGQ